MGQLYQWSQADSLIGWRSNVDLVSWSDPGVNENQPTFDLEWVIVQPFVNERRGCLGVVLFLTNAIRLYTHLSTGAKPPYSSPVVALKALFVGFSF
jgi:hypothetical protein